MGERGDIARDLVESVRKAAVGEVAKGVVGGVKAALVAALAVICALAWSLWTANPVATVALAIVSMAFGLAVGLAVGWRRACKKMDDEHAREIAEKDAEIDRLRRNIVSLEDVDRIMRHLPPNFYDILSAIYANGGSMVLPLSGELRGLVNRHVLNGDEGPAGAYTWSLPPGVMDYFDQRVGRTIVAGRPSATTGA